MCISYILLKREVREHEVSQSQYMTSFMHDHVTSCPFGAHCRQVHKRPLPNLLFQINMKRYPLSRNSACFGCLLDSVASAFAVSATHKPTACEVDTYNQSNQVTCDELV